MHALMCRKLGLTDATTEDQALWTGLLDLLATARVDYTTFFRKLGTFATTPDADNDELRGLLGCANGWDKWAERYRARLVSEKSHDAERKARMDRANPKYVLRNYLAQIAITKVVEDRDFAEVDRLRGVLERPFDEQPEMEHYAAPAPAWGKRLQVSCSS
jgi:uncharacterized protein YdiU (UPF0061 family)